MAKKKKKRLIPRHLAFVKKVAQGKTLKQAALEVGVSPKNPRQSGHQMMEQIRRRMPEILDQHGLTDDALIDNYLLPLMNAKETVFAKFEGKITDKRDVIAWSAREAGLDLAFKLKGSYATPAEAGKAAGPTVIVIDMPRPPRPAIDVSSQD